MESSKLAQPSIKLKTLSDWSPQRQQGLRQFRLLGRLDDLASNDWLSYAAIAVTMQLMLERTAILLVSSRVLDQSLTTAMWWFAIIWLGAVGGCVGSFLTVVWDRLGTGEGFVFPRSRCPECDHEIRWYHNLPIVGWFLLGGRCYDCGSRIPIKHPLVEAFFALLFVLAGLVTPWL